MAGMKKKWSEGLQKKEKAISELALYHVKRYAEAKDRGQITQKELDNAIAIARGRGFSKAKIDDYIKLGKARAHRKQRGIPVVPLKNPARRKSYVKTDHFFISDEPMTAFAKQPFKYGVAYKYMDRSRGIAREAWHPVYASNDESACKKDMRGRAKFFKDRAWGILKKFPGYINITVHYDSQK